MPGCRRDCPCSRRLDSVQIWAVSPSSRSSVTNLLCLSAQGAHLTSAVRASTTRSRRSQCGATVGCVVSSVSRPPVEQCSADRMSYVGCAGRVSRAAVLEPGMQNDVPTPQLGFYVPPSPQIIITVRHSDHFIPTHGTSPQLPLLAAHRERVQTALAARPCCMRTSASTRSQGCFRCNGPGRPRPLAWDPAALSPSRVGHQRQG